MKLVSFEKISGTVTARWSAGQGRTVELVTGHRGGSLWLGQVTLTDHRSSRQVSFSSDQGFSSEAEARAEVQAQYFGGLWLKHLG